MIIRLEATIYNPEQIVAILPVAEGEPQGIVFRTSDGWLGIDIGENCIAMSIKRWHEIAKRHAHEPIGEKVER